MKIVAFGNTYHIYGDDVKTYEKLPAGYYRVEYDPRSGYSIRKVDNPMVVNEMVYGLQKDKVEKVIRGFNSTDRNLGVLLSGDKGIGKSLFTKLLAIKCVECGLPVISVTESTPKLADYLCDFDQECLILFDEFDKVFGYHKDEEGVDVQNSLLPLFDGAVSASKKLFVITCNEIYRLNDFLVNRPGRFHYHFRFDYPSDGEIKQYLEDKLDKSAYGEIEKVIAFAHKVELNYDCLRSIAFELNHGYSFEETIKDINIISEEGYGHYNVTAVFNNGQTMTEHGVSIDMTNTSECIGVFFHHKGSTIFDVTFQIEPTKYLSLHSVDYIVDADDCNESWRFDTEHLDSLDDFFKPFVEIYNSGLKHLIIKKSKKNRNIHFTF